jgi:hypothetical protein
VGRDNIPVVLYEARFKMVEGKPEKQEKWAVMVPPRKKDIGIVCAGCYAPTMSLWDKSRCVSCRTFANHLDVVLCVDPENPRKELLKKMRMATKSVNVRVWRLVPVVPTRSLIT